METIIILNILLFKNMLRNDTGKPIRLQLFTHKATSKRAFKFWKTLIIKKALNNLFLYY